MSPAGNKHGHYAVNITLPLGGYVKENKLGRVYAAGTGFGLATNPDTVRAADVAFVSQARLDEIGDMEGFLPCAPDVVIEVNSPDETYAEVEEKVMEWLEAGSRMVIVVNPRPRKRIVTVYRSLNEITVLTENDYITGGDVVPGWNMPVRDIYA